MCARIRDSGTDIKRLGIQSKSENFWATPRCRKNDVGEQKCIKKTIERFDLHQRYYVY